MGVCSSLVTVSCAYNYVSVELGQGSQDIDDRHTCNVNERIGIRAGIKPVVLLCISGRHCPGPWHDFISTSCHPVFL